MKVAVVALTRRGAGVAARVAGGLSRADLYLHRRWAADWPAAIPFQPPLKELVGNLFPRYEGLVLVMATGIVVRVIAGFLRDKASDPAVVVVDEGGSFAISLLSGHLGGANHLAREVAACLGAQAVITTASDARGYPALDLLARELGCAVEPGGSMKAVMAHLVNGGRVRLLAEPACVAGGLGGKLKGIAVETLDPQSPVDWQPGEAMVLLTSRVLPVPPGTTHVYLRPRHLVVGVGCRRGVGEKEVLNAICRAMDRARRSLASLRALATVEFKGAEEGLIKAAEALGVPLKLVSRGDIALLEGKYRPSELVRRAVGVGGVCEPAAILATGQGDLLLGKTVFGRVTVAIASARYGW